MPIMEIKIIPMGTKTASVSGHVADAVKVVKQKEIQHEVTPMGTIMEDDSIERLFETAGQMHKAVLGRVDRVVTFIEVDERKDKKITMKDKLKSIRDKLNES